MTSSYTQYGRRKGSLRKFDPFLQVKKKPGSPVNIPAEFTILNPARWARIQDEAKGVNKEQEHILAAVREREALHQRSKEATKNWPDTFAAKRQKELEAMRIREELKEEERRQIDIDEANFQEQQRKMAIDRARTLQFFETDRVKRFHSALLKTEVLKEREAQIKLMKKKQNDCKETDKEYMSLMARNEMMALEQERQKTLEKEQKLMELAESWSQQVKEHEQAREDECMRKKEQEEECHRRQERYIQEHLTRKQKKQVDKTNLLRSYQEQFALKKTIQAAEDEIQDVEKEKRKQFIETKGKMEELWKEKEIAKFKESEKQRELVAEILAAQEKKKISREEALISKATAEAEAKHEKEQREKAEKRATMMKGIADHREVVKKELKLKKQEEKRKVVETLNAKKAADLDFLKKQQIKAQKKKEAAKMLQDTHVKQMAEKNAQEQCLKTQEQDFHMKYADLITEEERQFQDYAKLMIQRARETQRDTMLLHKAAKEGFGGGHGPVFDGVRPSYMVQDPTGAELPSYWCNSTQTIKELNESTNIQDAKEQLGFVRQV
ncbi:cilia- and flagella- associated protein 210-like [Clarias gariepinus]|uniref:cilia- and flagella- associated protein 210-like n=1 Tax=Clarias gariepinus TaxID=13013 RepID=UPI00234C3496|nr:cilia- and flagella- associated protein 210-like [Clarias gariepinus]